MIVKRDIRAAFRRRISITHQFYSQPPTTGSKTAKILCVAVVFLAEGFITSNNNHKKGNGILLALTKQLCDTNEIHASSVLKIRYAEMESIRVSKKKSKDDKLRLKMQMLNLEIDLWISQNGLSQTPRYLSKQLKNAIKKNARQKFEQNEDINLQNIFSLLPKIHKEHIMRLLGLASLRTVPVFQNIDEEVLGEICECLKPLMYTADDCIIQEGEPLEKILFITRGTVWSYTTGSNIANGGSTGKVSAIVTCLQQGDLCGKELLEWASIGGAPLSEFPISTVVVKAKTKVEGFAIGANDLKTFFSRSWRHFPNMELRRIWATCFIQTMWRMHQARVAASYSN